ncbi:ExbD/TolR family protein [Rhabdochromatium marinum]|uniref:ExbD/TolR family protein n=1 Tax=Rhabdochromatium marinum TaxID=48729 RepID=UPI00190320BC|nr:biopolymer transporter ExbD [Rhabdochromatium marinum]MBK1648969.1 biopolymer transporter ExbD [Rhabdochromatium marinum]
MRRRRSHTQEDSTIDLTPMLDVVFIMLIFFIVTATFVKESGVEFARPMAATAEKRETSTLFVGIDAQGRIWIDRRQVALAAVRPMVEKLRVDNPQNGAVIQADASVDTGLLIKVLDRIRLAGVDKVAVAAENQP